MLARVLAAIGRTMIAAGVLVLLFVAYQLWGTGLHTARAQDDLEEQFAALEESRAEPTTTSTSSTTSTSIDPALTTTSRLPPTTAAPLPPELLPARGDPIGYIDIEAAGIGWWVVEGVSVDNLKDGPGHYPETPLPGQGGNAAIAGHRTTYGAPFGNVDVLQPGDEIRITTIQGDFLYEVRLPPQIVSPSAVEVLEPGHWGFENSLTLTACHPKYSARERIVIAAELVGQPAPPTPRPEAEPGDDSDDGDDGSAPDTIDGGLSGERSPKWPAIRLGLVCAGIWLVAWAVGKRWTRWRWPAYGVGIVPFLVVLFFFFEEFSRLLPANY